MGQLVTQGQQLMCLAGRCRPAIAATAASPQIPLPILQRMQRRALDQWRTVNASDLLPELFQYTGAVGAVRNFALGFMDLIPTVKQRFTAIAAGAVGEGDYV